MEQPDSPVGVAGGAGALELEHMRRTLKQRLFRTDAAPLKVSRFVVLDRLGEGATGVVFSAYDPLLDRKVALKILRAQPGGGGEQQRRRMIREARALARLEHPNALGIFEAGEQDGAVFLVTAFVRGRTLRAWFQQGPHPIDEVLRVMIAAGRGLAAAHVAGVVHRDFKPESRRPSQTAPQPTDRPHSHSQGRFERVDVYPAAPGCSGVAQVLAKRWQRPGPPEDGRGPAHRAPQPCMKST